MRNYEDNYRFQGLRKKLIDSLREKGITDEKVLAVMNELPRHCFLDSAFEARAYEDIAVSIGEGQTISQPYTVAYQSQLLEIKSYENLLEIGTGSGYQAAVLSMLGAKVNTIERQRKLYDELAQIRSKSVQARKYATIRFFFGDGFEGLPGYAPFDKILITAAAPFIPPKLLEQLKPGGKMVLPLGEGDVQKMIRLTKNADGTITEERFEDFSFVPMLVGKTR